MTAAMDFSSLAMSLSVVLFVAIAIPALWRYLVVMYKLKNMDCPKGLPALGNLMQLGTSTSSFFKTLWKWADVFREKGSYVFYVGLRPVVVINNAEDAEVIFCNTRLESKAFDFVLRSWINDGLVFSKGQKWAFRRKLLTPSFHFSILSKFLVVFNEQAKQLTDKLCGMVNETQVDIGQLLTLCSLDIACETLMGLKLKAQEGEGTEYIKAVQRISGVAVQRMTSPWYWNNAVFRRSALGKEEADCLKILHQTTMQVIRERKSKLKDVKDLIIDDMSQAFRKRRRLALLDLLIEAQRQNNSFTDEGIQEEVDTFMFAGHDTVSSSTTFALYLLGRHPEVQRKVQKELDTVFGNDRERSVSVEDITKLEYLHCVVKESLRLLPPAPVIPRELDEDVNACGVTIPKGTTVFLGQFWLHRDPKQFPNPEKFDPDRFLPGNSEARHKFAFLPFGAGHRNCIGQKFALMEEKVILATVLRKLNVTSLQTMDEIGLTFELVLRTRDSIKVSLNFR